MVRGFGLSRSRSTRIRDNDISAQAEAISQPLLLATDAAPRGDLRVLQRSVTANGAVHSSRPWLEIEDSQRPARAKSPTYPPAGFGQHTNPRFEEVPIGAAYGSPSHSPLPQFSPFDAQHSAFDTTSPQMFAGGFETGQLTGDSAKVKGKWKGFGGLFAKKSVSTPVSPASPMYVTKTSAQSNGHREPRSTKPKAELIRKQSQQQIRHPDKQSHKVTRELPSYPRRHLSRLQKTHEPKPDMQRSQTAPMEFRVTRSPTPPPKDPIYKKVFESPVLSPVNDVSPFLQVNIPNVTMDRYSVMFGNLLQSKQPTLLERRQAQLENLRMLDDEIAEKQAKIEKLQALVNEQEQNVKDEAFESSHSLLVSNVREVLVHELEALEGPPSLAANSLRARSPSPALSKSPSFSLFPSTPTTTVPKIYGTPRLHINTIQRSMEALPIATSPERSSFTHARRNSREQSAILVMVHSPAGSSSDTPASSHRAKWSSDLSPTSTEASLVDTDSFPSRKDTGSSTHNDRSAGTSRIEGILSDKRFEFPLPTQKPLPSPMQRKPLQRIRLDESHTPTHQQQYQQFPDPTATNHSPSRMKNPVFTQIKPVHPATSATTRRPSEASMTTKPTPPIRTQHIFSSIHNNSNPLTSSPPSDAEISIARQISVSRRQRQALVPIVPKTARQPKQPVVVNVENDPSDSNARHVSRKSQHAVLEWDLANVEDFPADLTMKAARRW